MKLNRTVIARNEAGQVVCFVQQMDSYHVHASQPHWFTVKVAIYKELGINKFNGAWNSTKFFEDLRTYWKPANNDPENVLPSEY